MNEKIKRRIKLRKFILKAAIIGIILGMGGDILNNPKKGTKIKKKMKEKILKPFDFNTFIDLCRILLIPILIIIIIILIKEIEAVKILAYDVCKICMNKTGCTCTCITDTLSSTFNISYT